VFEELGSPMQVIEIVAANPHTPVVGPMPWLFERDREREI
jgi:hypothetical protein